MNEMELIEDLVSIHDSFMMGHLNEEEVKTNLKDLLEEMTKELSKEEIKKTIKSLELEDEFQDIAFDILKRY